MWYLSWDDFFLNDFQVILDSFPPLRRFLDNTLKVTKYHIFKDSSVAKNKQSINMAYFIRNASKIAFKRVKMFFFFVERFATICL
jgi:hypothetical protein